MMAADVEASLKDMLASAAAAEPVRHQTTRVLEDAHRVLVDFSELDNRCDAALRTSTAQHFPQIRDKIQRFRGMCSEFKLEFQQTLAKKLPSIRRGGDESVLAEILRKRHSSPFNSDVLNKWLRWKDREIYTVGFFTDRMTNTKIVPSLDDVLRELGSGNVLYIWGHPLYLPTESLWPKHVVCFVFTSLGGSEPYLSALRQCLNRTDPDEPQHPHSADVEKDQWFASEQITGEMKHKAKLFRDFAEANKEKQNVRFLTLGLTNERQKGSAIYLYEGGVYVSETFEPPSKPETLIVSDTNHNSVTLKVSPPRFGAENVASYCVEYCVSGGSEWHQQTVSHPGDVTVKDLRVDTDYVFRCRAVTSVGVGPHNDVGPIRILPTSTTLPTGAGKWYDQLHSG